MKYRILGPMEVVGPTGPIAVTGAKRRALLARLLLDANRVVAVDRLVDDLWEGEPPASAVGTLQTYVSQLRKLLGADAVVTRVPGYVLLADDVDATRFAAAVDAGRWDDALAEWRGPALVEFAGAAWAEAEAQRYEAMHLEAVEERAARELDAGRHASVVPELEALVREHPLRERLWALLMTALYRCDRQADALRAYGRLRRILGDELGIEPSAELRALEQSILLQELAVARPSAPEAALPSGVVTFLLTDIEGSTALWDAHAPLMAKVLDRHDELITAAVIAAGGIVLKAKGEGDATFSVFTRASDAVAAALAAQATLSDEAWVTPAPLRVRMALVTGEALERDGDYYGTTVNRAARLRALAAGGQVLVGESTAGVVRDHLPPGVCLRELGPRDLKDLARPEQVFELIVDEDTLVEPEPVVLFPAALRVMDPLPMVDREDALAQLHASWSSAIGGEDQRLVVVSGEPGIGKTRLVAEFARELHDDGALVVFGRCDEDAAAPYEPVMSVLRQLVMAAPEPVLRAHVGGHRGGLLGVAPELARRVPVAAETSALDPDAARWQLFTAAADLVSRVTAERPVLVVLDDLHWATKAPLALLRHLVVTPNRFLVVGTYRDTELDRTHPLSAALVDLRHDHDIERVALKALSDESVERLVAVALPDSEPGVAVALQAEADGNPFFIGELLRHLAETGASGAGRLPEGVKDAVGRRLSRLSAAANTTLGVAAVIGGEFDLGLLELVVADDVLQHLDHAVRARIVEEDGVRAGRYRFVHALVRQTLLDELTATRRARLHAEIADALPDADTVSAVRAHHLCSAASLGRAVDAARACLRAANVALARAACDDAIRLSTAGLDVLDALAPDEEPDLRWELLLRRGVAFNIDYRYDQGNEDVLAAARLALAVGDSDRAGRAVANYWLLLTDPPMEFRAILDETVSQLDPDRTALGAAVLARLAEYLHLIDGDDKAADEVSRRALDGARRLDPGGPTHVIAANARFGILDGSPDLGARAEAAAEACLPVTCDWIVSSEASRYTTSAWLCLQRGDRPGLDSALRSLLGPDAVPMPRGFRALATSLAAMVAIVEGRWDDAYQLDEDHRAIAPWQAYAVATSVAQRALISRERGHLADQLPAARAVIAGLAGPGRAALLVPFLLASGEVDEARELLATFDAAAIASLRRDVLYTMSLAELAAATVELGDGSRAAPLLHALDPFSGQLLVGGYGITCLGAADRFIGMLLALLGRHDEADARFTAALALEEGMSSPPLTARTRYWWARMLADRGAAGDRERAVELLDASIETTARLGMAALHADALESRERLTTLPLPAALAVAARRTPLVGRAVERVALDNAFDRACSGQRALVLVAGEPGVGKTRLVAEFASDAHGRGAVVLAGHCDEGLGAPYQPWIEALRPLSDSLWSAGHDAGRATDPAERWQLFEAVDDLLAAIAAVQPVVVVLDDLHWADGSSLLLLRHVARSTRAGRLMVVGTYRETELSRTHPLADALADLRRDQLDQRVLLRGLDAADTGALIAAVRGDPADPAHVEAVFTETEGNPFFVTEVLRHQAESGTAAVPEGVRDVVGRRLSRLSEATNEVLAVAAVVGRDFDARVIELAAGLEAGKIDAAVDEACAARVLDEAPNVYRRYSFAHALIRQTLVAELSANRRVRLHWSIGDALAEHTPGDLDAIARHRAEGVLAGDPMVAVDSCLAAGDAALDALGWDEALGHFEAAIAVLDHAPVDDPDRRYRALMGAGQVHVVSLRRDRNIAIHSAAADIAGANGWSERVVEAAVLGGSDWRPGIASPALELIERGLAAAGTGDTLARAQLLLAKAWCFQMGVDAAAADAFAEDAIAVAERSGDPSAFMVTIPGRMGRLFASADLDELERVLDEWGRHVHLMRSEWTLGFHPTRATVSMRRGDRPAFEAEQAVIERRVEQIGFGYEALYLPVFEAAVAIAEGRLADGRVAVREARAHDGAEGFILALAAQSAMIRIEEGRYDSIVEWYAPFGDHPIVLTQLGLIAAQTGDAAEAAARFDAVATDRFASTTFDLGRPQVWRGLAEVCALLDDPRRAALLEPHVRPYGGQLLVNGWGVLIECAADRAIAQLCQVQGRYDEAAARYESAIALEEGFGATALVTRSRYWYATLLERRRAPGDLDHADALLDDVITTTARLGMARLNEQALELRARINAVPLPPALAALAGRPFVGRDDAHDEVAASLGDGRRVALVAGEPGIGKSRLAAAVAATAHERGAVVLYGRCDEGLAAPYQPFIEALRHLSMHARLRADRTTAELTRLLPELRDQIDDVPEPRKGDPQSERWWLFDAIDELLASLATTRPVVVVLDDLHWADASSLLLLRHLARSARPGAIFLLGTYRETELARTHPLADTLADLRRDGLATRTLLRGLDEAATAALLVALETDAPADRVFIESEGNPFFVTEVARHFAESGNLDDVPEGVRQVVGRRLARLSADTNRALSIASVIGREFDAALVQVAGGPAPDAFDEAVAARVVEEVPGVFGRFTFAHALIRQTLEAELSTNQRVQLHWRIGVLLADRTPGDVGAIAHHLAEGAPAGEVSVATDACLAAGDRALAQVGWDEAAAQYERSLTLLDGATDVERIYAALIGAARSHRGAGSLSAMSTRLRAAAELAECERWGRRMAEVAYLQAWDPDRAAPDSWAWEFGERALASLGRDDDLLRARLVNSRLIHTLSMDGAITEPLIAELDDLCGDAPGEMEALRLGARLATLVGTHEVDRVADLADRIIAADPSCEMARLSITRVVQVACAIALGDRPRFESGLADHRTLAKETGFSMHLGQCAMTETAVLLADGRFDEAQELIASSWRQPWAQDPNWTVVLASQTGELARELGHVGPLLDGLRSLVAERPRWVGLEPTLAELTLEAGDADTARAMLDDLVRDGLSCLDQGAFRQLGLGSLANLSAGLGDRDSAAVVEGHLRPYSGLLLMTFWGLSIRGAADRFLAQLCHVQGRDDEAESLFQSAIALEDGFGARALAVRSRHAYARMLADVREKDRARDLLDECVSTSADLGMVGLHAECVALRAELD